MSTIPAGYKRTEGGVIPVDWLEYTLGELIEFEGGSQPDKSVFRSSWKPGYVRLIQIRDYKTDRFETYIPAKLARRFCDENDIMIGRYGPPVFQILRGIEGAYNVALIKAKPLATIKSEYAYYFLKQDKLFGFIEKLSQRSSGQTGVDLKELRQYPLPLPPTDAEQEAIAEALSDADDLIESLEQLLAKKRHLKQGSMQELLTGKKRLPGFSGEWEVKRLGEVLTICHGKSQHAVEDRNGSYPILATGGQIGTANHYLYDKPSVLIGRKGTIDEPQYMDTPFWSVDTLFYSVIHEPNCAKFLFYRFCLIGWKQHNEASGVPSLNAKTIERIEVAIPRPEEQTAIASTLSDMDTEIATLDAELAKTRALKQGMMQKLLTGEIRLI